MIIAHFRGLARLPGYSTLLIRFLRSLRRLLPDKSKTDKQGLWDPNKQGWNERGSHSTPLVLKGAEDIRVTSIDDGNGRHSEVLSASGTEIHAVALVVVDGGLGEHSVILELRLSQGRAVVGDEDQLS